MILDGLMKKYGLTRDQAAGIVGNLAHESAGFTAYQEKGKANGSGGAGWAQWTGPRRRAFEGWAAAHKLDPKSDEASWRYLTEGDPETAAAIRAVKGQSTAAGATRAWHDSFERSGDIRSGQIVNQRNWNDRLRYANSAAGMTPGGATASAGGAPGGDGAGAAPTRDSIGLAESMLGAGSGASARALGHIMHAGLWCADFTNGIIEKSGGKGSGSSMASSFANWGKAVMASDVKRGDVILENAHGRGINHVGMATGNVQRDKAGNVTAVEMISGNYGDQVRKNWERMGIIAGLRRGNEAAPATEARGSGPVVPRTRPKAPPAPNITAGLDQPLEIFDHDNIHGAISAVRQLKREVAGLGDASVSVISGLRGANRGRARADVGRQLRGAPASTGTRIA